MPKFELGTLDTWYVNLDSRLDRREHVENQLKRVGLHAQRQRGYLPTEWNGPQEKIRRMYDRTPGAIGCHMSQTAIIARSLLTHRNVLVLEDDVVFCTDFMARINYIENFLDGCEWDIFWLGATFHCNPPVWHAMDVSDPLMAHIGRDVELTDDPRILRTYGIWSTYAYIVNADSAHKILTLFDQNLHLSIGIDYLAIMLQPKLNTFCFVPGCVVQYDNQSNIGTGVTTFSNFKALGPYWYADRMTDFDPVTFNWAEARV